MKYVAGFLVSFDLQEFLLVRKEKFPFQDKWIPIGGKIENTDKKVDTFDPDVTEYIEETPHQAMAREFAEETKQEIKPSAWHCFHVKEYSNGKIIYFFVTFGDMIKKFIPYTGHSFLCRHSYIDLVFNSGSEYVFDTKYLIDIILSELRTNNLMLLNPYGVNKWKTDKKY